VPETIIPDVVRAQVVFENRSKMPKDRVVNTFHFADVGPNPDYGNIAAQLQRFYNEATPGPPSGARLSSFISPVIDRTIGSFMIRLYNLGQAPPREAHTFAGVALQGPTATTTPLPNEMAVTLSFYGERNLRRQRGRIYFGPLTAGAVSEGTADQRVHLDVQRALTNAAKRLITDVAAFGRWIVLSDVGGEVLETPVVHGWVDDAFDVQRRRGAAAGSRLSF
jgi:hypothetical protein